MERQSRTLSDVNQLLQLRKLLDEATSTVIEEWASEGVAIAKTAGKAHDASDNPRVLPSRRLHQAQRTILSIAGALTELVTEPHVRVQELATQYYESRALSIAAERRIPDILAAAGEEGVDIQVLAEKTGIQYQKLSRLLRCLCSNHVFRQVGDTRFANNRISATLANDEDFRAYILLFHLDIYTVSDRLPAYLLGPNGHSFDVSSTVFQEALAFQGPRWEWMGAKIDPKAMTQSGPGYAGVPDPKQFAHLIPDQSGKIIRPELEIFSKGMVGGGKVSAGSHPFDFPWNSLRASARVVDVGGGMGGFIVQLMSAYPNLVCTVQDRAEVIAQAQSTYWPKTAPGLLASGRIDFQVHDFFQPNPVHGADVYWMRGILHDWSDSYCVDILKALKPAMTAQSRILICDQVMNTTHGSPELSAAPSPLPANYGYYTRYQHLRDISLMTSINGIERTPQDFKVIIEGAGLRLEKIWETRSLQWIVEARL